ncbi:MAG: hypothetical protein A3B94_01855 [Candidatus Jacksonbacteria bacterium RIFCSPHIGHO2_02_FULL_43_10]|nr:MAG: hypothetical protein A3B94_01855 [Candidatus Jacksonbacteria bacterium RIFCSPHIGHO2_02_FULL_43_10]
MAQVRVIIVTYNSEKVFSRCLEALEKQTYTDWSLTVIDNASSDASVEIVKQMMPSATIQCMADNIGYAQANNWGIERSQEPYLFLLNPDCFIEENYITEMVFALDKDDRRASCTGILYRNDEKTAIDTTGIVLKPWHAVCERKDIQKGEIWGVSGAALFLRRSALDLDKVSPPYGFDPRFHSYKEDVDLAYRFRNAGYRAWCTDTAHAIHLRGVGSGTVRQDRSFLTRYWSYRNHVWMLIKNVRFHTWLTHGVLIIGYEILKALYLLVKEPQVLWNAWKDILKISHFVRQPADQISTFPPSPLQALIHDDPSLVLSIIILNYNSRGLLKQCVRSIEMSHVSVPYEIIIVDNASRDDSVDMIEQELPHVRLIQSPKNLGYGGGNNIGIQHARGSYILILNPDVTVLNHSIEKLLKALEDYPDIGLVAPQLLHPDKAIQYSCYRFPRMLTPVLRRTWLGETPWGKKHLNWFLMRDWDHTTSQHVDWVLGGAMMMHKALMRDLGGFDSRYFLYFEDVDLCRTMLMAGKKVWYCADAQMVHYHKRQSAKKRGILGIFNPLTRIHIQSGIAYFKKWRWRINP